MLVVLAAGLGLLAAAVSNEGPQVWWWMAGGLLTLVGGVRWAIWIAFWIRYPTREARQAHRERVATELATLLRERDQERRRERQWQRKQTPSRERDTTPAHRAIEYRDEVLRYGVDGTAVITGVGDADYGNEYRRLAYLELEVCIGDAPGYPVRTGAYVSLITSGSVAPGRRLAVKVDPADAQRVAVDWDRTLRPPGPTPAG